MTISEAKQDLYKKIGSRKYVIAIGISRLKDSLPHNGIPAYKDENIILVYLDRTLAPRNPKLPSSHKGYKIIYKYQTEIRKQ